MSNNISSSPPKDSKSPEKKFSEYQQKPWVKPLVFTQLTDENQAQVIGELIDVRNKLLLFNNFRIIKTSFEISEIQTEFDRLIVKTDAVLETILRSCKGDSVY